MALDRIYVEIDGADKVLREFEAKPKQIERASRRAVQKVCRAAGAEIARGLAAEHDLPLKTIGRSGGNRVRFRFAVRAGRRGRLSNARVGFNSGDTEGVIWIGHRPIKSAYLGKLKQSPTGASAGRHFFEGAFVATMKTGHTGVFRRTGRGRLPIVEQAVALDKAPDIIKRVADGIPTRLATVLRQELNFEVNVRGAG